jgi:hypothetical protein
MSTQQGSEEKDPRPPQPPPMDRGPRLSRSQWIGLPIIAVIPVLAIFGVFGERRKSSEAESSGLRARVEYPTRLRAMSSKPMIVRVENRSSTPLDTVDVVFDPAYMEHFSAVAFIPPPRDAYTVSLLGLRSGETRIVHVDVQGERIGRHDGRIVVRWRGDSIAVALGTTVFP